MAGAAARTTRASARLVVIGIAFRYSIRMLPVRFGVAVALLAGGLQAQPPRPATEILAEAQATAAAQRKTVWLIFHASW